MGVHGRACFLCMWLHQQNKECVLIVLCALCLSHTGVQVCRRPRTAPTAVAASLPSISGHKGYGGIAVNVDGTLFASVDDDQHCVYIYSVDGAGKRTADPVVVGTAGTAGSAHVQLNDPRFACFVHRHGIDPLLI